MDPALIETQTFQGLAPAFVGSISDETGRRPSYLACFVIYIGANVGLALQNNYAALFVLRCLQSSGSSGTVALANAVVADIVTSAERGTYISYVSMGALVGPALGPVIGGLLSQYLGWRAIFWFLTIFAGVVVTIFIISFPETCRKVVGNGSLPAQKWNISLLSYLRLRTQAKAGFEGEPQTRLSHKSRPNPLNAIYIIFDRESGIVLLYGGALFSGFYMVLTGMPSQLQEKYGFNTLQIGLCYIPTGVGAMAAAIAVGRFLDWNFRRHAQRLGIEISNKASTRSRALSDRKRPPRGRAAFGLPGQCHYHRLWLGHALPHVACWPYRPSLYPDVLYIWRLSRSKHSNRGLKS